MKIKTTVYVNDEEYDVTFDAVNLTIGDGGEGPYEFWGQKGRDSYPVLEDFDIDELRVYDEDGREVPCSLQLEEDIMEAIKDDLSIYEEIMTKEHI